MNPYDYVTDDHVKRVEHMIHGEFGGRLWDGSKHPVEFLHEVAGPELADEYREAVHEYMQARELLAWRAPAERLFRAASQPLVQQFLHSWNVNSRVDELAVLLGAASSLNKPAVSVADLGCGPGLITRIIARLIKGRVIGVDRENYWDQSTGHRVPNAEFRQQDVIHGLAQEQSDIIYANGLKQHCDPSRFWEAIANWLRPEGFAMLSGEGVDTSSGAGLHSSLNAMNGLFPVACIPVGGPHSAFKPDDPGTVLLCRKTKFKDDLEEKCTQLVDEYQYLVASAERFLNDESVPYRDRTFSKFILKKRVRRCSE